MARVDVRILGAGLPGRILARRLTDGGACVALHAVEGEPEGAWPGLGLALPCHPEHPHRFLASVGAEEGRAIVELAAVGLAALPGLRPIGVDWACRGPEAADRDPSIQACRTLGLPARATEGGLQLDRGGVLLRGPVEAALAHPVLPPHRPGADEDAEITLVAAAWAVLPEAESLLADVLTPVRWHWVGWSGAPGPDVPVVSRQASVFAWGGPEGLTFAGARWMEPHLGIGDRAPTPLAPRVVDKLADLARQDEGVPTPPDRAGAFVVGESCDGLPVVGPVPGRPRVLVCTGFGVAEASYGCGAAVALADGLLGRPGPSLPPSFSAGRFR